MFSSHRLSVFSMMVVLSSIDNSLMARQPEYIATDLTVVPMKSERGNSFSIAVPVVYNIQPALSRLIGGSHRGSLRRDVLRKERYSDAIRMIIYQPMLEQRNPASVLRDSSIVYEKLPVANEILNQFIEIAPRLINKRYVRGGTWKASLHNSTANLARRVRHGAGTSSHLGRCLKFLPAVIEGGNLVNDFLLHKALATDAAEVRFNILRAKLIASSKVISMDPALMSAIGEVNLELSALRTDAGWSELIGTVIRNKARLLEGGGSALATVALKKIGTNNPGMLAVTASLMTVSSLADHQRGAQLSIVAGTIAVRLSLVDATENTALSNQRCAEYVFCEALRASSSLAITKVSDALKLGRPHGTIRDIYGKRAEKIMQALLIVKKQAKKQMMTPLVGGPVRPSRGVNPGSGTIHIHSGNFNVGRFSSDDLTLHVKPAQGVTGSVICTTVNRMSPNAVVQFGYTWTWGDRRKAMTKIQRRVVVGKGQQKVEIRFKSPTNPGVYYLILAFSGEFKLEQVMSGSNWAARSIRWEDGNDLVDIPEKKLYRAAQVGYVTIPLTIKDERTKLYEVAICPIRILVE